MLSFNENISTSTQDHNWYNWKAESYAGCLDDQTFESLATVYVLIHHPDICSENFVV